MNVSAAPLVGLNFAQRNLLLSPGTTGHLVMIGDFADEAGVILPPSYATISSTDPSIVLVTSSGQLSALANGTTTVIATAQKIQAVTVFTVGYPTDSTQQSLLIAGLDDYPKAIALAAQVGTRQLKITIGGTADVTAGASGTRYSVSNPDVVHVTADGLVIAGNPGVATITVINGPAETTIPVRVEVPEVGPAILGPAGGVVRGSDGSLVAVPPGALTANATVGITARVAGGLAHADPVLRPVRRGVPARPERGRDVLAAPDRRAGAGIAPGTKILFYRAATTPDGNGNTVPIWMEDETGVVGTDGFARSTSPPHRGFYSPGLYMYALFTGYATSEVTVTAVGGGELIAASTLISPIGLGVLIGVGVVGLVGIGFVMTLPLGPHDAKFISVPPTGPVQVTPLSFTVTATGPNVAEAILPLSDPATDPPVITGSSLIPSADGGPARLTLLGNNLGYSGEQISVTFVIGGEDGPSGQVGAADVTVTGLDASSGQVLLDVPDTVAIGTATIILKRTYQDSSGKPVTLESLGVQLSDTNQYVYAAIGSAHALGVFDGRVTIVDPNNPSATIKNPNWNQYLAKITVGDFPKFTAATADNTRDYVLLMNSGQVAVIDAFSRRKIDAGGLGGNIDLPAGAYPSQMVFSPDGRYAYVTDENGPSGGQGAVYVIDINPNSAHYNQVVQTIHVTATANIGLRGLAFNNSGTRLFVAAPNSTSLWRPGAAPGHIDVINTEVPAVDDPGSLAVQPFWTQVQSIEAGQAPWGITATPKSDTLVYTDFLAERTGVVFGTITGSDSGGYTATPHELSIRETLSPFDVSNARAIVITPDLQYAFVTGYNAPFSVDIKSKDQYNPPDNPGGGNVGIIRDPLGPSPQLVAGTRSIPVGFPNDIRLSTDANSLYVTYPFYGLYVYNIPAMIAAVNDPANADLSCRPSGSTTCSRASTTRFSARSTMMRSTRTPPTSSTCRTHVIPPSGFTTRSKRRSTRAASSTASRWPRTRSPWLSPRSPRNCSTRSSNGGSRPGADAPGHEVLPERLSRGTGTLPHRQGRRQGERFEPEPDRQRGRPLEHQGAGQQPLPVRAPRGPHAHGRSEVLLGRHGHPAERPEGEGIGHVRHRPSRHQPGRDGQLQRGHDHHARVPAVRVRPWQCTAVPPDGRDDRQGRRRRSRPGL